MGLFFYTQKGSIISTVVLPTTEIIEPFFLLFVKSIKVFDEKYFEFNSQNK
ncbi:hypothetical protein SSUD9_0510 [Streptococcus suis D9]|nr:hypothetical protein SSUD9_0510 [Streptococcus suis D9]